MAEPNYMDTEFNHSAAWAVVILMVVIASWFLYRFLAPKSWREWASAGLVQAFVIALYAEMYGFPLTIYLLVRFFGLDKVHLSANLWSTLLGVGELGKDIAFAIAEPFAQSSAASLERRYNPDATPESVAAAAERGRQLMVYEPQSRLGKQMKSDIQSGITSLGQYLMDPENRGPAQLITQEAVVPALEAIEPISEAVTEGIISLMGGDDPLAQAEAEASRPLVGSLAP